MLDAGEMGKRIAYLRKTEGFTQMELAEPMDVSFQAVSNWERGQTMPDLTKLYELAGIFDISVDEILNGWRAEEHVDTSQNKIREDKITMEFNIEAIEAMEDRMEAVVEEIEANERFESGSDETDELHLALRYISRELVDELGMKAFNEKGVEALVTYARYMSREKISEIAEKVIGENGLTAIKPIIRYVPSDVIDKYIRSKYL